MPNMRTQHFSIVSEERYCCHYVENSIFDTYDHDSGEIKEIIGENPDFPIGVIHTTREH